MHKKIDSKTNSEVWVPVFSFYTVNPICFFLSDDTKKKFRDSIKIDNITSKRIAIMGAKNEF